MPKALTPQLRNQHMAAVHALGHHGSPPPQTKWIHPAHGRTGQAATPARIVAPPAVYAPNTPNAASLAQGIGSDLTVICAGPTINSTHNAATGYNLRSSPSGAGIWSMVSGVTRPYTLIGLAAGAAFDVQVQSSNTAGTGAWSAISTLATATAIPNTPSAASLAQGAGSNLTVTWPASAIDSTHNAATGYNLRSSPSGAGTWTTVPGVTSPYTLTGLAAGVAIDVQVQSSNITGVCAGSVTSTLSTATAGTGAYAPNTPVIAGAAPPADGTTTKLTVIWTAPTVDGTHNAATGDNPVRCRQLDDRVRYHQPVHARQSGGRDCDRCGSSSHQRRGKSGHLVGHHDRQNLGCHCRAGRLDRRVLAGSQRKRCAERRRANDRSLGTDRGDRCSLRVVGEQFRRSDHRTDRGRRRRPDKWLGAVFHRTSHCRYLLPLDAGYLWMLAQGAGAITTGALVTSAITVS